jgi:ABC-type transport system involved in multi-copper enzyme maturation permease subunit
MGANLLYYRPWRGRFRAPGLCVWPIARVALATIFRRRLFWTLYGLGLLIFLMFFFGQFLLDFLISLTESSMRPEVGSRVLLRLQRAVAFLNGNQDTYRYFFFYQGQMLIIMLALAGAVLVGNDFTFGSLPFYLAKPVSRWHYVLGKCLAAGILISLMTTLPALLLYVQNGFGDWDYFFNPHYFRTGPSGLALLLGILGYGLVLAVFLSLLLVATASWLGRTMPMVMVWMALFVFLPVVGDILAFVFGNRDWWLLDIWDDLCQVGNAFLGIDRRNRHSRSPGLAAVVLVLGLVCILCLSYLNRRTRVVEIVR